MTRITKKILFLVVMAILVLAIISSGCSGIPNENNNGGTGNGGTTIAQKAVHGTISTGTAVDSAQGMFISLGGTITVNKPGSPIDGLKIEAPAGAYQISQPVKVSYSPITGQAFGNYFNPVTPVITIDAGHEYADQPLMVTIPINITSDQFPMAFYYNDTDKQLEGIPTVTYDTHSITITTMHFCDIVVSAILNGTLDAIPVADSGFKPGVDDWEFENDGSYVAPLGHCSGQSLTMMWYYTDERQKAADVPPLNGRFDDNGRAKTPDVQRDDTEGYRFASVAQVDDNWDAYKNLILPIVTSMNNSTTFYMFKYSILMTGEPQLVRIVRSGGAHAIVCYKVAGNTMYIADPNYPGQERTIQINGYKFTPYSSGDNSQDITANGAHIYPRIYYMAKSALISWDTLAADYKKMQDGTIGDDKFLKYDLMISIFPDDQRQDILAYKNAGKNEEVKRVQVNYSKIGYMFTDNEVGHMIVEATYKGKTYSTSNMAWPMKLDNGSNIVAIEVYGSVNGQWKWMGFNYIDFYYQPDASPTPTPTAAPGNERKPDRAPHDVTIPAAPAPVQTKTITNSDGSSQAYSFYKDNSGRDVTWGSYKAYYPGGTLQSDSTRLDTKTVGYSRSYNSDGKMNFEQYRDDNGVLKYQDYYASNGKLRQAIDYWDNGKEKDRFDYGDGGGPLQYYYEYDQSGTLKLKETWSNGKLTGSTTS